MPLQSFFRQWSNKVETGNESLDVPEILAMSLIEIQGTTPCPNLIVARHVPIHLRFDVA